MIRLLKLIPLVKPHLLLMVAEYLLTEEINNQLIGSQEVHVYQYMYILVAQTVFTITCTCMYCTDVF